MDRPDLHEALVLPARLFARGWLSVWGAAGTEKDQFHLYRVVRVEVFPDDGVRLIGSDGGLLLRTWVPLLRLIDADGDPVQDEPPVTEQPAVTLAVFDEDKRAGAMMNFVQKATPADRDADGPLRELVLSVARFIDDEVQPTLGGDLERWAALFAIPDQRLLVPLIDAAGTDWRHAHEMLAVEGVERFALSARNCAGLAKLGQVALDGVVDVRSSGPDRPMIVFANGKPPVHGLVLPTKRSNEHPADRDDVVLAARRELEGDVDPFETWGITDGGDPADGDDEGEAGE